MLFQVLCGSEPIFYTTHPNEEPILLSNISQSLENTKFVAGELSLIVSLVLYRPTSVYEL